MSPKRLNRKLLKYPQRTRVKKNSIYNKSNGRKFWKWFEKVNKKIEHACLGIVRLDYDYPPQPGDIDCSDSFNYDVFYRVVPGLTFDMCMSNTMTPKVEIQFRNAVKWLSEVKNVSGISGDCGFMMYF